MSSRFFECLWQENNEMKFIFDFTAFAGEATSSGPEEVSIELWTKHVPDRWRQYTTC
jgi:hypothetical protein